MCKKEKWGLPGLKVCWAFWSPSSLEQKAKSVIRANWKQWRRRDLFSHFPHYTRTYYMGQAINQLSASSSNSCIYLLYYGMKPRTLVSYICHGFPNDSCQQSSAGLCCETRRDLCSIRQCSNCHIFKNHQNKCIVISHNRASRRGVTHHPQNWVSQIHLISSPSWSMWAISFEFTFFT